MISLIGWIPNQLLKSIRVVWLTDSFLFGNASFDMKSRIQ